MDYHKLGNTGLDISPLCLGCMTFGIPDRGNHSWTLDEAQSRPILRRAQEFGLRCGFAVLLSLFVFTTVNDLTRLGALSWVAGQF